MSVAHDNISRDGLFTRLLLKHVMHIGKKSGSTERSGKPYDDCLFLQVPKAEWASRASFLRQERVSAAGADMHGCHQLAVGHSAMGFN
jgi:hypothetical protein